MIQRVSHYELLDRLGTGGMGTVWRARDTRSGATVAIKVLHPHLATDADYVRRFEREARVASDIESENVVKVIGSGKDGERYFLVMEYVPGQTLAQIIQREGALSVDAAVSYGGAVARALAAAHARGIVHRDVSPQNVIVTPQGVAKVTDFGVARDMTQASMTATSAVLGKPQYIAPEVVTGSGRADIRGDIYALGIVLYQMLTGSVPFTADTPWNIMQRHVSEAPPSLRATARDAPEWLAAVVQRCLAKNPGDRYQTPGQLVQALAERRETFRPGTPPPSPPRPAVRTGGTGSAGPLLLAGGIFGVAVVVIVIVLALAVGSNGGDASGLDRAVLLTVTQQPSIVTVAPTATSTPRPSPTRSPAATPTPRSNCEAMRGTDYTSPAERTWFLQNCLAPESPPDLPPTPQQLPPNLVLNFKGFLLLADPANVESIPAGPHTPDGGTEVGCPPYTRSLVGFENVQNLSTDLTFQVQWKRDGVVTYNSSVTLHGAIHDQMWHWIDPSVPGLYTLSVFVDSVLVMQASVHLVC